MTIVEVVDRLEGERGEEDFLEPRGDFSVGSPTLDEIEGFLEVGDYVDVWEEDEWVGRDIVSEGDSAVRDLTSLRRVSLLDPLLQSVQG